MKEMWKYTKSSDKFTQFNIKKEVQFSTFVIDCRTKCYEYIDW